MSAALAASLSATELLGYASSNPPRSATKRPTKPTSKGSPHGARLAEILETIDRLFADRDRAIATIAGMGNRAR